MDVPTITEGDAGWCPGGYYKDSIGGTRYCTGIRYDDGSFYSQPFAANVIPFQPGHWQRAVMCSALVEGQVQGYIPYRGAPSCGRGPQWIHL